MAKQNKNKKNPAQKKQQNKKIKLPKKLGSQKKDKKQILIKIIVKKLG